MVLKIKWEEKRGEEALILAGNGFNVCFLIVLGVRIDTLHG
jgi:hypothetical protein